MNQSLVAPKPVPGSEGSDRACGAAPTRFDHWLVWPSRPTDGIRYRRALLASYLQSRPETDRVYCVYHRRRQRTTVVVEPLGDGTWGVGFRDPLELVRYLGRRSLSRLLHPHLARPGVAPVLWYTHPSAPSLARQAAWHAVVYDCSDRWSAPWDTTSGRMRALRGNLREAGLRHAERLIVRSADRVVVSAPNLAVELERRLGRGADLVAENGVDFARFSDAAFSASTPRRLIYAGGLKPSVDYGLLGELAHALPDAEIVLAGPIAPSSTRAVNGLLAQANVCHLGFLQPEELVQLLLSGGVGLLPYRETNWTQGASALKFFEYLAAGLPVVGVGIPAAAAYHERGVYFHAQSREQFVAECRRLVDAPPRLEDWERRRSLALGQDWNAKFAAMVGLALPEGERSVLGS